MKRNNKYPDKLFYFDKFPYIEDLCLEYGITDIKTIHAMSEVAKIAYDAGYEVGRRCY